jgi:hypothetical protein
VGTGIGEETKFNRFTNDIPKSHSLEAACAGKPSKVTHWNQPVLEVKGMGRGESYRTRVTKYGFSKGYCTRKKNHFGFWTGDIIRAEVLKGKKIGIYVGRRAIKRDGNFTITTKEGPVEGINHRYGKVIQRMLVAFHELHLIDVQNLDQSGLSKGKKVFRSSVAPSLLKSAEGFLTCLFLKTAQKSWKAFSPEKGGLTGWCHAF